jgi:hypothetical protein
MLVEVGLVGFCTSNLRNFLLNLLLLVFLASSNAWVDQDLQWVSGKSSIRGDQVVKQEHHDVEENGYQEHVENTAHWTWSSERLLENFTINFLVKLAVLVFVTPKYG